MPWANALSALALPAFGFGSEICRTEQINRRNHGERLFVYFPQSLGWTTNQSKAIKAMLRACVHLSQLNNSRSEQATGITQNQSLWYML